MSFDALRGAVTRRPFLVVGLWLALAVFVAVASPDLTRLAAEGQANLLDKDAESYRGAAIVKEAWPDQAYESLAVVALVRPGGLNEMDRAYAARLADRFESTPRPKPILRILGPKSDPRVAGRLVSQDGTTQLLAAPLSSAFVAPSAHEAVAWLQKQANSDGLASPAGLELKWSGDAVIGRDYMRDVQTSLDRAALVTVILLMVVLMVVYRSAFLAMVPLATIGLSLVIARGLLAWLVVAGWEVSPLVELFLVAILFGSGTDFCLFVSWRFSENWNPKDPPGAMAATLRRTTGALLTSAGTVIIGLLLMGTTKFKLFSSTGPSVALGLGLTVLATLTLTPALLVLLARYRPRSFAGMTSPSSGFWENVGHRAMARPALSWVAAMVMMVPIAVLGTQTEFLQDTLSEMPRGTESVDNLKFIGAKMGPGLTSPLTVVLEADADLRSSQGLALVDDVSRLLQRQRRLAEVRSATQPLGSTEPFDPARLSNRLRQVNNGLDQIAGGAALLSEGLKQGLAKLEVARMVERATGLSLTNAPSSSPSSSTRDPETMRSTFSNGLKKAAGLFGQSPIVAMPKLEPAPPPTDPASPKPADPKPPARGTDPASTMVAQLARAVDGAGKIAEGSRQVERQLTLILNDPVGRRALDRLLVDPETIREHPEIVEAFHSYITEDGHRARLDLSQSSRIFSAESLDQVETLRRRLHDHLEEEEEFRVRTYITGTNAGAADSRALTHADQVKTWFIVPLGVFIVLMVTLRDPMACVNLVATMLLTYLFALGVTHLVFVTWLGAEAIDWKVPYFLFVLLVAVGVDYNVFLITRLHEDIDAFGLRAGIVRAIGQTGGLISSAAAITAASFSSFLFSPLSSLRQLGFALVVGIAVDALIVRPLLVPCGHWFLNRKGEQQRMNNLLAPAAVQPLTRVSD